MPRLYFLILFFLVSLYSEAQQRSYAPHSVLATGNWVKMGVKQEGVYKVDIALLNALGVNTANLTSASIRLYGNGGGMLDESVNAQNDDDLTENAIAMFDGGDGVFNNNDYFLFYAPGTARWEKDSLQQLFHHHKNLYGDTAYYYLTIGGTGKRIQTVTNSASPTVQVNSYNERYFYENDLVNLLSSGKEWYGEEFGSNPGVPLSRSFPVDFSGLLTNTPLTLISRFAGRTVNGNSSFQVNVNGQPVQTATIASVSGYFLDHYATATTQRSVFTANSGNLSIGCSFQPFNGSSQGWLDWLELHGRKSLIANGNGPLFFRDWSSVGSQSVAAFSINNTGSGTLTVWDITDARTPVQMSTTLNGAQVGFTNDASRLREYMAFSSAGWLIPVPLGKLANQDLHQSSTADYIIVTHPAFLQQAQRLAQFHQQREGLRTAVVQTDQLFNEFGGGMADPTAIRDCIKMYAYRAGTDSTKKPRYLLLMGAGSFDYRNRISNNINLVPCYESDNSLDPLLTYTSDDFFGLLTDSISLNLAVGRIPARTVDEAAIMVDKIIRYHAKESLGSWRTQTVYVADDKDNNLHLNDAETLTADAAASNPLFNQQKIYLDAYPLVSSSSGGRYPAVNDAIVNRIGNGALLFNYSGHGSYERLSEEAVLGVDEVNRFSNPNKLPLFITASCDFAPHDDPQKKSLGAAVLTGSPNGAIALLTTTRLVFAYSNRLINDNYLKTALQPAVNGNRLSLGESVRRAKNLTVQGFGDVVNTRKFALLGDPAMYLAIPSLQLKLTSLNGKPLTGNDTLKTLNAYQFGGVVTDANGVPVNDFSGTVYPTIFDRPQTVKTLGNDPASPVTSFQQQTQVLYKGSATVTNGQFQFSFVMPKDISFNQQGKGRISLYAEDGVRDGAGIYEIPQFVRDDAQQGNIAGPAIRLYLNDTLFLNGGLTNENPLLIARLFDSSGINTSGNGIGHDIIAVIDGNENNTLVLNDFYTADKDTYQRGSLKYQLSGLTPGRHTLRVRAWNVANQSAMASLDFMVIKRERLSITRLLNYPNPFSGLTHFSFEHNQPGAAFSVKIGIYTSGGQLVRQLQSIVQSAGSRNAQLSWNGTDAYGRKLEKGIYIYRVIIALGGEHYEGAGQMILF